MAFRRRRRYNGVWLPTLSGAGMVSIPVLYNGNSTVDAFSIIAGSEPLNNAVLGANPWALSAAIRPGLTLKRIVGQLTVANDSSAGEEGHSGVLTYSVRAGFAVDRTDEDGALQNLTAWDLFTEGARQKRWLWTREWVLTNGFFNSAVGPLPFSNYEYSGAASNGSVDWKGGARISYEERLWLIVCTKTYQTTAAGIAPDIDGNIYVSHNFRILGKPSARNNR